MIHRGGLALAGQCKAEAAVLEKRSPDEILAALPALIEPILIVLLCTLLCNYICGFLMHKICKLDISTSLFGSIPAGVSDMALIATDLGGDAPKVAVLQLVRYIGLFSVMPIVIKYITG